MKNYYKILDVPSGAAPEEIKKSFRALALQYHPDKAPDNPFAADHFTEIQEAYEILSHATRRARYDEERWLRGLGTRSRNAETYMTRRTGASSSRWSRDMSGVEG